MKGIWKYDQLLPPIEDSYKFSLGEGGTPLVRSRNLGPAMGLKNLFFKLEMMNPSGSYKDRFAALAVADLLQRKADLCLATSSGNTGAALAAYCAAASIRCFLVIVDGAPEGKLRQMQVYGAETLMVKGFGKDLSITRDTMQALSAIATKQNTAIQISAYCYSPTGMAGVQTIAYEIANELRGTKLQVFSPAGGGGLTLALVKGFAEWKKFNPDFIYPKLHCVQPSGNDTISGALHRGLKQTSGILESSTLISGLQVPNILDGNEVIAGCRLSGGSGYLVADEMIYACQEELAAKEGIFCEPAGAVAFAGMKNAMHSKGFNKEDHLVCLVTGSGFKDPGSIQKIADKMPCRYFDFPEDPIRYMQSRIVNTHKHIEK